MPTQTASIVRSLRCYAGAAIGSGHENYLVVPLIAELAIGTKLLKASENVQPQGKPKS